MKKTIERYSCDYSTSESHDECRLSFCNCIIETTQRARKRCDCKRPLNTDIFVVRDGWFIAQECLKCGLFRRITEFNTNHSAVIRQFNRYHNPPPKYKYDVSVTVAFSDYRGFDMCLACADNEYGTQNFGIAVDRGLLRPLVKQDDVKPCVYCGK